MRGSRAKIRKAPKDSKYGNEIMGRFINKIMVDGKKAKAQKLFYNALETSAKEVGADPVDFINQVVDNIRPALELKARRVGGANYQVPVPVTPYRQEALAIRWLVDGARNGSGAAFVELFKKELIDTFKGESAAIKKKEETERMAEANKAFAHFKW